jgi:hypothetical protein
MAQAVNRQCLTTQALAVRLASPHTICCAKIALGEIFLPVFWLSCTNPPMLHTRFICLPHSIGDRSGTVVKVLCYKSEGRWFNSRWCHWNFSLT